MAEGTHTSGAVFGLNRALGRGPRIWSAYVQVADSDTIDTGLDTIEGIGYMKGDAPADEFAVAESITGGIITIGTGQYTSVTSASAADIDCYMNVVGIVR